MDTRRRSFLARALGALAWVFGAGAAAAPWDDPETPVPCTIYWPEPPGLSLGEVWCTGCGWLGLPVAWRGAAPAGEAIKPCCPCCGGSRMLGGCEVVGGDGGPS